MENFFLTIKQKMNMKLFTEGFLEILKINFFLEISTWCIAVGGQTVLFLFNKRFSFKKKF